MCSSGRMASTSCDVKATKSEAQVSFTTSKESLRPVETEIEYADCPYSPPSRHILRKLTANGSAHHVPDEDHSVCNTTISMTRNMRETLCQVSIPPRIKPGLSKTQSYFFSHSNSHFKPCEPRMSWKVSDVYVSSSTQAITSVLKSDGHLG